MHGDIFEIPLYKGYGFGYAQVVLTGELGFDNHVIFRPYDLFSKERLDPGIFQTIQIIDLGYPSIGLALPSAKGKNKWTRLINHPVLDFEIPKFKADFTTQSWESPDWESISWFVISNLVANGLDGGYEYSQVRHLPFWKHCSPSLFSTKLSMLWMIKQRQEIKRFIDIGEQYNYQTLYNEVMNSIFASSNV